MTCSSCLESPCIRWGVGSYRAKDVTDQALLTCLLEVFRECFPWALRGAGMDAAGFDLGYR